VFWQESEKLILSLPTDSLEEPVSSLPKRENKALGFAARNPGFVPLAAVSLAYWALFLGVLPVRLTLGTAASLVEPQPVAAVRRLLAGENLYQDYRHGRPVLPLTYGVLAYAAPAVLDKTLGIKTPEGVYRTGRAFSFAGMAGCAAMLFLLARQRGVSRMGAWTAVLPLAWFPYIAEWFTRFTPDAAALLFSLAGWAVLGPPAPGSRESSSRKDTGAPAKSEWMRGVIAVCLWLAAFHLKPTQLAGQIAFAVEWLAAGRGQASRPGADWRSALRRVFFLAAGYTAAVAATIWLLQVSTGGNWKLNAVDSMSAHGFRLAFISDAFKGFGSAPIAGAAPLSDWAGGKGVLLMMLVWAIVSLRRSPLHGAYCALLGIELLFLTKRGGNINYLLGSLSLWAVATAVALRRTGAADGARTPSLSAQVPAVLISVLLLADIGRAGKLNFEIPLSPPADLQAVDKLVAPCAAGEVLVADGVYGAARDLPYLFADCFHASLLARSGAVDFSAEIESIQLCRYRLIVTNLFHLGRARYHDTPVFPQALGEAIRRHYRVVHRGKWFVVWEPAPRDSYS